MSHRGREFTMRPGSIVLLKLDEPFFRRRFGLTPSAARGRQTVPPG